MVPSRIAVVGGGVIGLAVARRAALGQLRVDGLALSLARGADDRVVLPGDDARPAAANTASPPSSGSAGAEPAPWALSLDALVLRGARLQWRDASLSPPAALGLDGIDIDLQHLAWPLSGLTGPADGRAAATLRGTDGQPAGRLTAEVARPGRIDYVALAIMAVVLAAAIAGSFLIKGAM